MTTDILQRDSGLRRQIGAWGMGAAVINGVVGAGIFTLPATMARAAGAQAPLAYLLCGALMALVVLCFAEAGSRLPTSGGVYGTVTATLGPLAGFVCGMMTWTASVLACGGIAGAFAATLGSVLPVAAGGVGRALVILLAIGGIAAINLRGAREAAWVVSGATLIKLVPLVLFVVVGGAAVLWGGVAAHEALPGRKLAGLGQAVILGVFAFSGMETPLAASGEVADARRNLPRALFGAMGFVLVLYVGIQLVAQAGLGAALAGQAAPLAAAADRLGPVARGVLVAGAGLSMLAWIGSDILGAPRVLFAFARDGLLPRVLGRTNAATGAPDVAIAVHAAIAVGLALWGSFDTLVVASALNTAGLYFLGCAAAWVLHRRDVAVAGTPFSFAALPVVACGGMSAMVVLVCLARRVEVLGLLGVVCGSIGLYAVARALAAGRAGPGP